MSGTGHAPALEDELFFEDENALYNIDVCFTKYGENSTLVRDALKDMMRSVRSIMEEENLTEIMADLTTGALHGASRFNLGMTGCPNCCVSPYMRDVGIIMQHRVDITDAECTQCGNCLKMCIDKAIQLTDEGPVIDREVCAQCELCARDCPTGKLVVHERGFRVIAGGAGGRHPSLAVTIEDFTSRERVHTILRNAVGQLRGAQPGETLRSIIEREGIDALR
jgi:dissimilatory sulfite reductase (desulfoviridin) alpha/beta subunit